MPGWVAVRGPDDDFLIRKPGWDAVACWSPRAADLAALGEPEHACDRGPPPATTGSRTCRTGTTGSGTCSLYPIRQRKTPGGTL